MNTYSQQFQALTHQYPDEVDSLHRLESLFSHNKRTYIALEGLYALARPASNYALLKILTELVDQGYIGKSYQIISPINGEGIKEFSSFLEIPHEIEDWRSHNETITVTPSLVKVIYKAL